MGSVLFRLRTAIVRQRHHVVMLYKGKREWVFRKMIQPLQIESLEITWLTILHYCTLFPGLPSPHLLSYHLFFSSFVYTHHIFFSLIFLMPALLSFLLNHSCCLFYNLLVSSYLVQPALFSLLVPLKSFDLTWFPFTTFSTWINSSQLTSISFISFWFLSTYLDWYCFILTCLPFIFSSQSFLSTLLDSSQLFLTPCRLTLIPLNSSWFLCFPWFLCLTLDLSACFASSWLLSTNLSFSELSVIPLKLSHFLCCPWFI